MRLWIAVHLPNLPLEVFTRHDDADRESVVIHGDRVIAASVTARACGIRTGARRGGVTMLAPQATLFERDPEREQADLHAVAMTLLQYTPEVALADEHVILMGVGASLRLFGGVRALCRRICADVRTLGFSMSSSCAPTARGAWLLAKHAGKRSRVLKLHTLEKRLDPLPAFLIPPTRKFADWLEGLGCNTISHLRALPRPGLQRRCGRDLLDVLDAAYGLSPEMYEWFEPPETFRAQIELFDRVEKADQLLVAAHRLVLQMLGWLCARQLAVRSVTLAMVHERGREARPNSIITITLADPTWEDTHLVRLLKERLGRHRLDAFVIGLALEAADVVPMEPPSESLFPDPRSTEKDQQALFDLLAARLGTENVLKPLPKADYRPEVANAWVPVSTAVREAELQASMPPLNAELPRPTWLLATPIPLLVRQHKPWYSSPLTMVSRPERIEAGWWSTAQARDYFVAESESGGALYWVYRERTLSSDGEPEPRWFLHGLFG
jgi:protein ImuB